MREVVGNTERRAKSVAQETMTKPNGKSRPRRLLSLFLKSSLSLSVFVVTLFVLLKTYDAYVGPHRSSALPGLDIESRHTTIHTLELHPFTGWHVQSNFAHKGPMSGERNPDQEYDIRSGQLGFFVDFDLDNPPQKGATGSALPRTVPSTSPIADATG